MKKFSDYRYFPSIRTRQSELEGVSNIGESTKSKFLPVVSLTKLKGGQDADSAIDKWFDSFNNESIIEISHDPVLKCIDSDSLYLSDKHCSNWIDFLKNQKEKYNKIIPAAIFHKDLGKRDYVKQLEKLESYFGRFVVKINPLKSHELLAAITAASIVDDISNVLFILDVGQINSSHQDLCLDATISGINMLRDIDPRIEIVSSGTSFPRTFAEYGKESGAISMLEWQNYLAIGGEKIALYGDAASIHGEFYPGSYAKFVARIDYPTPGVWRFERRSGSEQRDELYQLAARDIVTDEGWDDSLAVWGTEIIKSVSEGNVSGFKSPSKWISVRVNLHIERMIRFIEDDVLSHINDDTDEYNFVE
ncbi:beta family protein [Photorhabdus australis]|uniref:beta family protein n=1 Tax=Photorhabdus australis TaxID=286156 RepID=UPI00068A62E4|nr:hypothetical protein [Photorhabdus australis]